MILASMDSVQTASLVVLELKRDLVLRDGGGREKDTSMSHAESSWKTQEKNTSSCWPCWPQSGVLGPWCLLKELLSTYFVNFTRASVMLAAVQREALNISVCNQRQRRQATGPWSHSPVDRCRGRLQKPGSGHHSTHVPSPMSAHRHVSGKSAVASFTTGGTKSMSRTFHCV